MGANVPTLGSYSKLRSADEKTLLQAMIADGRKADEAAGGSW
jgi:hypothetical protein